jgi:hypothetical protein
MTEDDVALFNDSLERYRQKPGLISSMISRRPSGRVAEEFAHTDMLRQAHDRSVALQMISFTEGCLRGSPP